MLLIRTQNHKQTTDLWSEAPAAPAWPGTLWPSTSQKQRRGWWVCSWAPPSASCRRWPCRRGSGCSTCPWLFPWTTSAQQKEIHFVSRHSLRGQVVVVGCLMSQQLVSVSLRDGSVGTIVCATTLRQKLQIKLFTSPSYSILTLGQPDPALTLCQVPGRAATGVPILESLAWLNPEKSPRWNRSRDLWF